MNRQALLTKAKSDEIEWDIIIIGGGASGLGILHEASLRGYRCILFEKGDFASATSSGSTKLIHGGIRYLKDFSIPRLLESAQQQDSLKRMAPHLVHSLPFVIPCTSHLEHAFIKSGLLFFDLLTLGKNKKRSSSFSNKELQASVPNLNFLKMSGAVSYEDCQFDDARYALELAISSEKNEGIPLNYCSVSSFIKTKEKISGVKVLDNLSGDSFSVRGKTVINACGPFVDDIRKMDHPEAHVIITPVQGTHITLPIEFLGGNTAFIIPNTSKGKVLYGIPWQGTMLVGTTETTLPYPQQPSVPQETEIEYLLKEVSKYLLKKPSRSDILGIFSGIRPLLKPSYEQTSKKTISREHGIFTSKSGLLTITGGKWTTYRIMAHDILKEIVHQGKLPFYPPVKHLTQLSSTIPEDPYLRPYGNAAENILKLEEENPLLKKTIHPKLGVRFSMIHHAITNEMAMTLEDLLTRRSRCSITNRKATVEAADDVAEFAAQIMQKDLNWIEKQKKDFLNSSTIKTNN